MTSEVRIARARRFGAFLILVTILAFLATLPSVSAAGMLVGRVVGMDIYDRQVPLARANITVYAGGVMIQSVSPRFDGSFSILLPLGVYTVVVEHPGFKAQNKVVQISDGHLALLDFYLESAPMAKTNAFDFTLSSSGPLTISAGESGSTAIEVALRSGPAQIVSLSVSGLPPGASVSFSSLFGSPSFTSICTIKTSVATPVGSYAVTLIGFGGGMVHRASFALTISQRAYSLDVP